MRPQTLAEAVSRIRNGSSQDKALSEFLDTFYLATTDSDRYASIAEEPEITGDERLDAWVGAMAEYLAKQYKLGRVPRWTGEQKRYLERAWHTCRYEDAGMREYLTFSSPAEFASRNIFTEERPLRRARGPRPAQ
jgi:hypothetical protein